MFQYYSPGPGHLIGRFRFSVTSDDRSTFADGLASGGDVTANWTVLTNPVVSGPSGMTFTTQSDSSILAGQSVPATSTGIYEIRYTGSFSGITGIRLEVLEDPSLPTNGPGLYTNGNFVLTEMEVCTFSCPTLFTTFTATLDLTVGPSTRQDVFDLNGTFTLGGSSNGIAPLTETVSLVLAGGTGAVTITIPAGSFATTRKGAFTFQGTINGVALQVQIALVGQNQYAVKAQGTGADLTGLANPVTVTLTIGDDSGTTTVIAQIQ